MAREKKVNILLVDDRAENLTSLETILADLNQNLVKSNSGREALHCLLNQDFAAILLDVQMPEMNGFETAEIIRQRNRSKHTPIIFLTAYSKSQEEVFKGYTLGAVDYVFKPIVPEILKAKVRVFVELSQMYEKVREQTQLLEQEIVEHKQTAQKLRQTAAELERSNKELESFAYIASHDLQEPLRKVITFGERLKTSNTAVLDEKSLDCLNRMQEATVRMQQLISGLLTLSRVTTQAQLFQPVDLNTVINDILFDLEVRIKETRAQIEVGHLPTISGDSLQIRQLFQNLIANALKFRKPGDRPYIVIKSQTLDNGLVEISVEDNGIGFEEQYIDRIFKPFQRLHTREEYEGVGMGLAICQKIVQRHGGEITAQSKPGEGARFVVRVKGN